MITLFKKKKNNRPDEIAAFVYAADAQEFIEKILKEKYEVHVTPKKKFNIDDWQGKYGMYCETREELLKFYDYLHSVGRRWYAGSTYKEFRPVVDGIHRRVRYLYFNNGTYSYENDPFYKIINFKDFDWSDIDMRKTKFNVGDKVKVVGAKTKDKQQFRGRVFTIKYCSIGGSELYDSYAVNEVDGWRFFNIELELFEKESFTKADLKPGMVVELRGGGRYLFVNDNFANVHEWSNSKHYNNDLTHSVYENLNIVKVYTSTGHTLGTMLDKSSLTLVWERKEETKEMTVAEIEKELGYKVKIVDGE